MNRLDERHTESNPIPRSRDARDPHERRDATRCDAMGWDAMRCDARHRPTVVGAPPRRAVTTARARGNGRTVCVPGVHMPVGMYPGYTFSCPSTGALVCESATPTTLTTPPPTPTTRAAHPCGVRVDRQPYVRSKSSSEGHYVERRRLLERARASDRHHNTCARKSSAELFVSARRSRPRPPTATVARPRARGASDARAPARRGRPIVSGARAR